MSIIQNHDRVGSVDLCGHPHLHPDQLALAAGPDCRHVQEVGRCDGMRLWIWQPAGEEVRLSGIQCGSYMSHQ